MGVRILIADDHGLVRAGLRALLNDEADLEVVGEAADGEEALQRASQLKPDLVLMDISMPGTGGIEAARRIRSEAPAARILMMTVHEDEGLLQESIRAGASGYIVKRALESELIDAIRAVCQGHLYVHPTMTRALLRGTAAVPGEEEPTEPLTPREREVLAFVARGYTNRQIADQLTLSVRTVESHRANLMSKLGLRTRADVVRYAREHGFL